MGTSNYPPGHPTGYTVTPAEGYLECPGCLRTANVEWPHTYNEDEDGNRFCNNCETPLEPVACNDCGKPATREVEEQATGSSAYYCDYCPRGPEGGLII